METNNPAIPEVAYVAPVPEIAHIKVKPGPVKGDPRAVTNGRKGGMAVSEKRGSDFYRNIGKKGGQSTKAKYGPDFFSAIGRKGGETVKKERGADFFATIGSKGGNTRWAKQQASEAAILGGPVIV